MANDLQASISTKATGAVQAFRDMDSGMQKLKGTATQVEQSHSNMQQKIGQGFRNSHGHAKTFGHQLLLLGRAFGMLEGPAGRFAEVMGRSAQQGERGGAIFGRIAAAAGVAALAYEAYNLVIEHNVEQVKAAIEAEDKHREAVLKGREARTKVAEAGMSNEAQIAKVAGIEGGEGVVNALAKEHPGIDIKDIRSAMIASQHIRNPTARRAAMDAAIRFQQSGAGTMAEGVQEMSGSTAALMALRSGHIDRAAALAREQTLTGRAHGGDTVELSRAIFRNLDNPLIAQHAREQGIDNQTTAAREAAAAAGGGEGAKRAALADALHPEMGPLLDLANSNRRSLDALERIAAAQGPIARLLSRIGVQTGAAKQLVDAGNAQADVVLGDPQ